MKATSIYVARICEGASHREEAVSAVVLDLLEEVKALAKIKGSSSLADVNEDEFAEVEKKWFKIIHRVKTDPTGCDLTHLRSVFRGAFTKQKRMESIIRIQQ